MIRRLILALVPLATLSSCGYHVAGKSDLLPKEIHTIAIPAFNNATSRVRFSDAVPSALTREFIRRSRYRIVADPNEADAVLSGTVLQYNSYPILIDPVSGRPSGVQMIAVLQVRLTQRGGKLLFDRPAFEARQRYEISADQLAYFEESGAGIERLAQETARSVVSAILENF
ncbi:MAG: LptE family protein [Acidobacteriota bacterium]